MDKIFTILVGFICSFEDRSGRVRHLGPDIYTLDAEGYLDWEILLP